AETVDRPPPPCVGTHPASGWKSCGRFDDETARNSAYVVVVVPGPTGAPSLPVKSTCTSREVTSASSPATTLRPCGHVKRYWELPCAGTTTQGPGTRMHAWIPWHSLVAPAGAATVPASTTATATAARQTAPRFTEAS